jgi:hypothetical protein
MSLNRRQRHQLYRIEARLLRADPHLAAMLGVFGRLSEGQRMPVWEHIATRQDRIGQAAALIVKALVVIAAAIRLLFSAVRALFAAVVIGGRARPVMRTTAAQETSQTGYGGDDI